MRLDFSLFSLLVRCSLILLYLQVPLHDAFTPAPSLMGSAASGPPPRVVGRRRRRRHHRSSTSNGLLLRMSGDGIAKGYTWHEEAFELEVTVNVPKETRAKDILFKAMPTSIDLRLVQKRRNSSGDNAVDGDGDGEEEHEEIIMLLDPSRKLRGRVSLEGTFWVISDPDAEQSSSAKRGDDDDDDDGDGAAVADFRQVTVTIEKQIRSPKDDFDVIDYDWKGLYFQEEEGEVLFRRYDEAEELDVRDYAASLGVDIDNINMSLVDKSMFSSGLNLTQSSLDSLTESGLMKEVTQQSDGSEWITGADGERVPFNSMGGKMPPTPSATGEETATTTTTKPSIPFLDTNSPWHTAIPVDEKDDFIQADAAGASAETDDDRIEKAKTEAENKKREEKKRELQKLREQQAADPIGTLTVSRLKEILKSRGLKVSGNKKELQDRLRAEVSSLMVQEEDPRSATSEDSNSESSASSS